MGKNDLDFKSKLELTKELICDAIEKKIPFRYCLFDSWYSASDVLRFIHEKNLHFITEVKSDRRMLFNNPATKKNYFTNQDELVTLIYWVRQNGYLHRSITSSLKGKSINECKQALLKLILFSSYQALRKNNTNITSPPH